MLRDMVTVESKSVFHNPNIPRETRWQLFFTVSTELNESLWDVNTGAVNDNIPRVYMLEHGEGCLSSKQVNFLGTDFLRM